MCDKNILPSKPYGIERNGRIESSVMMAVVVAVVVDVVAVAVVVDVVAVVVDVAVAVDVGDVDALPSHFKAFSTERAITWLNDKGKAPAPRSFCPDFREIRNVFGIRDPKWLHPSGFVSVFSGGLVSNSL